MKKGECGMKKSGNVVPFPFQPVNVSHMDTEMKEVEKVAISILKELKHPELEDVLPREATIGDWVIENCNALPVHEEEGGRLVVAVPILTFDEMVALVVNSINGYEEMKSALEKIAKRGNELEGKIARDALSTLID
jgi:hypothetical protein